MSELKILIGTSTFGAVDDAPLRKLSAAGFEAVLNPHGRKLTRDEIMGLLTADVVGLLAGLEPLDRQVLEHSSLKALSRVGVGMSNVDVDAAGDLGITVCFTPNAPTTAVAELAVGSLLSLLRMIPAMDRSLHEGGWDKRVGTQLEGKTVAIIGFGRIGRRFAELLEPFRVRLVVVDPSIDEPQAHGHPVVSLSEALAQADIVSFHASGDACILGEEAFSLMRTGCFVMNASRGGVVDEAALVRALDSGKVQGAWIDTFEEEPYAGALSAYSNVLLTPHVGTYTAECRLAMELEAVDNLLEALGTNNLA